MMAQLLVIGAANLVHRYSMRIQEGKGIYMISINPNENWEKYEEWR